MKLNQEGWGLSTMIILVCCLVFGLIIAAFLYQTKINSIMYSNDDVIKNDKNNNEQNSGVPSLNVDKDSIDYTRYHELEDSISASTKILLDNVSYGFLIVPFDELKTIIDFESINNKYPEVNKCKGYVILNSNKKEVKSYLNCKNIYQSSNYNVDFE